MSETLFDKGLAMRKEVLGEEYVTASIEKSSEYAQPFQKLVTEHCWGDVWTRPGLDKKTRSMLNLAMLCALGRTHEVKLHTRGAINNGVSVEEIQEILLQVAIYCGMPAALDGFKATEDVLKDMGEI